jgi:predicted molibdopterin-dependent oxidoreductase YjgC
MDGMVVKSITSDKVLDARNGVVEFLLINHPLDCPYATRLVNVICKIFLMNMVKKERDMSLKEEHLIKKISGHIYNYT